MNWSDGTSYSRFDKERVPRIWELSITKKMTLIVHRHIYDESTWFMTLHNYHTTVIDMVNLCTDDADKAKADAIGLTIEYLYKQKDELENVIKHLKE